MAGKYAHCGVAVDIDDVDVGPCLDQLLDYLEVPLPARDVERRPAKLVASAHRNPSERPSARCCCCCSAVLETGGGEAEITCTPSPPRGYQAGT